MEFNCTESSTSVRLLCLCQFTNLLIVFVALMADTGSKPIILAVCTDQGILKGEVSLYH
jgi:hypothetical protein